MNQKKIKILKELKQKLVQNFGNNIVNVILFGSQSTGLTHKNSDYDIIVVLKNEYYDWHYKDNIRNVFYDYSIDYEMFFDILIITEYEINNTLRGVQPIFTNALNKGIYI